MGGKEESRTTIRLWLVSLKDGDEENEGGASLAGRLGAQEFEDLWNLRSLLDLWVETLSRQQDVETQP